MIKRATQKQVGLISYLVFTDYELNRLIPHRQALKGITRVDYRKSDFEDFVATLPRAKAGKLIDLLHEEDTKERFAKFEALLEDWGFMTAAVWYKGLATPAF